MLKHAGTHDFCPAEARRCSVDRSSLARYGAADDPTQATEPLRSMRAR